MTKTYMLFGYDVFMLWLIFVEYPLYRSSLDSIPVCTTLCGDYPCGHSFMIQYLIMISPWVIALLGIPHCGITMDNDASRNIHCDVTMGNDITMCPDHNITMHNNIAMNLFCYVLLCKIMILLFHR